MSDTPKMHCHQELLQDLRYSEAMPDEILMKWFNDYYSTSKHLLTLYSIAKGTKAKTILEVGFGRSSFVFAKAAIENDGMFYTCDSRNFLNLFNEKEKEKTKFFHGLTDELWPNLENNFFDVIFLDYFSGEDLTKAFIRKELTESLRVLKDNGVLLIHDVYVEKYKVGEVLKDLSLSWGTANFSYSLLPFNYGLGIINKKNISLNIQDHFYKKNDV